MSRLLNAIEYFAETDRSDSDGVPEEGNVKRFD